MNKIYKYLLSYFFFLGCGSYNSDFMTAYSHEYEKIKMQFTEESGQRSSFQEKMKSFQKTLDFFKTKVDFEKSNGEDEFLGAIKNGKLNNNLSRINKYITNAFLDYNKDEENKMVREISAYLCVSQPIFNIMIFSLTTSDYEIVDQMFSGLNKILKYLDRDVMIKILIECQKFYEIDDITIETTIQNIQDIMENINLDSAILTHAKSLIAVFNVFLPKLINTANIMKQNKEYFKSDSPM